MARLEQSLGVALVVLLSAGAAAAQTIENERARGKTMLQEIEKDIRKHYYDPTFHGLDLDQHFATAQERMKTASSLGVVLAIVGQAVMDLNDSHTRFFPPQRSQTFIYGWKMRMVGDDCYVLAVRPGSDAEKQGLKPGDKLTSIAGFPATRDTLWKLRYLIYTIRPVNGLRVMAQSPGGAPRAIDIRTETHFKPRVLDWSDPESLDFWELVRSTEREDEEDVHRYFELGEDALVWQMPAFDLGTENLDRLLKKVQSRKALVLDMRGNGGGLVTTLERLIGRTFAKDVRLGEIRERTSSKPWVAPAKGKPFEGKIVALVDSDSGSAAELFARVLQIEKRGIVLGDRTAGAVMRSRLRDYRIGVDQVIFYYSSISEAAVVMSDGGNLEGRGLVPDETILPSGEDLAARRDPVLARALQLAGVEQTPEQAGAMFPVQWSK